MEVKVMFFMEGFTFQLLTLPLEFPYQFLLKNNKKTSDGSVRG